MKRSWGIPGNPDEIPEVGGNVEYVGYTSNEELAEILGWTIERVKASQRAGGTPWTPEEDAKIEEYIKRRDAKPPYQPPGA